MWSVLCCLCRRKPEPKEDVEPEVEPIEPPKIFDPIPNATESEPCVRRKEDFETRYLSSGLHMTTYEPGDAQTTYEQFGFRFPPDTVTPFNNKTALKPSYDVRGMSAESKANRTEVLKSLQNVLVKLEEILKNV